MDIKDTAKDAAATISGARSRLARWVDGNPKKTAAGVMVAGPLAIWKLVELAAWLA